MMNNDVQCVCRYVCVWANDTLDKGDVNYTDGRKYKGGLNDLKPHGAGCMTYPDGRTEEGNWVAGLLTSS